MTTERPTVPCKWCGTPTTMVGSRICEVCWNHRSLRDEFATHAISGLLASPHATQDWIANHLAESAYRIADSMLAQRIKV